MRKGFTIIELMLVVSILAVLITIVVAAANGVQKAAREKAARASSEFKSSGSIEKSVSRISLRTSALASFLLRQSSMPAVRSRWWLKSKN